VASSSPLGEVGVAVDGTIDPLLKKFAAAEAAADAFYKRMTTKLARVPVGGASGGAEAGKAAERVGTSLTAAAKAGDRYHQTIINVANDNRMLIQIVDNSTRTFNNQRTSIDASSRSLSNVTNNYRAAGAAADGMERQTRRADAAASDLRRTLLASAGVVIGAFGANKIKDLADGYTRFTNQLKVAGIAEGQLAGTQDTLFGIAQKYGVELEAVGTLYGRVTQSGKELGASQQDIIKFTNGVSAALKIQGGAASESKGALLQLSQLLGAPKVQAQEFNSILDGARPLIQAVANGIDKYGGSIAKLRADIIAGNVTSKEFFQGFLNGSAQLETQATQANLTIGASFTTLNNALGRYIGQTDKSLSATQRIGGGIKLLADNLDVIMPVLTAIILAMGARYAAAAGTMILSSGLVQTALFAIQARAAAAATTMEVLAFTSATAGRALLAAFGGPVGVAILAIGSAVYFFHQRAAAASAETENFNNHQKEATKVLEAEADRATRAAGAIKQLGSDHKTASAAVKEFAGQTGDAANALYAQAKAARRARFDLIALTLEQAKADRTAAQASAESADANQRLQGGQMGAPGMTGASAAKPFQDRVTVLDATIAKLEAAMKAAPNDSLESYVPNARTGGRDIAAEIANLQKQLVAAEKAHNLAAQKELLKQIKIRQRVTALMAQGLSLEIANATAETEGTPAGRAPEEGARQLGRPVQGGTIRGTVGEQRPGHVHAGTDYAVKVGTPVSATAGGTVIEAGTLPGYGNVIIIDHGRGLTTRYAHLSQIGVGKGATVAQGDQIGLSGGARGAPGAGNSQGPHLHYEVRKGGRPVDPNGAYATDEVDAANKAEQLANQRVQKDQAFGAAQQQVNDAILGARESQLVDEVAIADAAKNRINGERNRERDEIENRRKRSEYSVDQATNDARAKELTQANEDLRVAQLAGVSIKERQRLESVMTRTLADQHDRQLERLQLDQDMARTATERRAVERRILANQKEFERQTLEATVKSEFTKPEDRKRAEGDLKTLDDRYRGKGQRMDRDAIEDMYGSSPSDSRTGIGDQKRQVGLDRDDKLATVDEGTAALLQQEGMTQAERERILQESADRRVDIEMEAAKKILDLETQRKTLLLKNGEDIASGLATIAEGIAGKQSGLYRGLFATAKAFAIAQASIALYQNVAEAMKYGFPQNIPFIAAAIAQGATIMSSISAISGSFKVGGHTGYGNDSDEAGVVHRNEYVFDANATRRIGKQNLDSIRAGRNPTAGITASANDNGGLANAGQQQRGRVLVKQMPGVAVEYRENMTTGDVEMIAKRAVETHAPGVVATDMARPNSRTRKALQRNTTARGIKS
jgi:tape measure domain-containing protein